MYQQCTGTGKYSLFILELYETHKYTEWTKCRDFGC